MVGDNCGFHKPSYRLIIRPATRTPYPQIVRMLKVMTRLHGLLTKRINTSSRNHQVNARLHFDAIV